MTYYSKIIIMKKKLLFLFPTLFGIIICYIVFRWFSEGLYENTRGISNSIQEAKNRNTFISEYQQAETSTITFNSILAPNASKSIWLENIWYYKRWGNIEVSNDYTLCVKVEVENNTFDYSDFNEKWRFSPSNNENLTPNFYATRNEINYLLLCSLKKFQALDTLTFNVSNIKEKDKKGQIILVRKTTNAHF